MNQQKDFADMAKAIIDSTLYMVLGTADESGQPWVSPVYFTASKYKEFYWISSPEAKHSRNIAQRSQISIVIFNSQVPVGQARAVYMSAAAEELTGSDLERGLVIYNGRFPDPARHGVQDAKLEEVRPPGLYRLYRAVAVEHWVLDPYASPHRRTPVTISG
ncbi:MAG TPA: pyridoxamine 5'-phosphate oxidase family protein [Terriglobales bacterium]|nr:pyridoxamine 5'-phosphate oxidase family protein [Terriglobales bacterium]